MAGPGTPAGRVGAGMRRRTGQWVATGALVLLAALVPAGAAWADAATGAPTISGTATVGEELTADTSAIMDNDGLTGVSYRYQWVRVDGTTDTNVGSDSSTYPLVDADAGNKIKVTVSFTDDANNAETLTSAAYPATGNVQVGAPGPPRSLAAAPGLARVTLNWQAPQSNGGSPIEKYSYRVSADGGRSWNPDWTDVPDGPDADTVPGNETTLTATGLRRGTEYTFQVTAYNGTRDSDVATAKATPISLTVAVASATIAEASGTSEVTVSTPTAFSSAQPVTLVLGGTAAETDDYTVGSKSLTFAASATEVSTTVTAVQDTVYESSETVIVATGHGGTATITISDDDPAPTFSVAVDDDSLAEDGGTATVTISISNGVTIGTAQTIRLVLGGTATHHTGALAPSAITISARCR